MCGFFAISGFLVTASLLKRGLVDYTISRALRIYPALAVCVFATVFILGPALTRLSLSEYFSHPTTWNFLTNALLFMNMVWTLPGVFESNVLPAVNGSLWTLPVEVSLLSVTRRTRLCRLQAQQAHWLTGLSLWYSRWVLCLLRVFRYWE